MSITIEVSGEPRPKQSFRYTGKNGKGGGFTPASIKAWQETVAWQAKQAMSGQDILTGELFVILKFRLGNQRRVDIDNLSKAVLDAMNGIVYEDDTKIIELFISKCIRKDNPGVTINVDDQKNKYCRYCNSFKPLNEFHKRTVSEDGAGFRCKSCNQSYQKEYYLSHKEITIKRASEWNTNHPERRREITTKSLDNRRIPMRETRRLQANEWRKNNLEHARVIGLIAVHRRKAREMLVKGNLSHSDAELLIAKAKGLCVYCGKKTKLTLDHVIPISKGGANSSRNIIPCCKSCNSQKGTKTVEDWLYSTHGAVGLARAYIYLTRKRLSNKIIDSLYGINILET